MVAVPMFYRYRVGCLAILAEISQKRLELPTLFDAKIRLLNKNGLRRRRKLGRIRQKIAGYA